MKADSPDYLLAVRRDGASSGVLTLAVVALIVAMVSILVVLGGDLATRRSDPVYWMVLLPFVGWGAALITYTPFALKTVVPLLILLPCVAGLTLVATVALGRDPTAHMVALGATLAASIAAAVLRRRSLLADARKP